MSTEPFERRRFGKTAKDKKSGAKARALKNRAMRVQWEHDPRSMRNPGGEPFPVTACNGKRNKHRYMKAGKQVIKT